MSYIDEVKINNAVHECLDRCYRTDDARPQIAEFLEELKSAGDWREAEIHEVELIVHKVLHGVLDGLSNVLDGLLNVRYATDNQLGMSVWLAAKHPR